MTTRLRLKSLAGNNLDHAREKAEKYRDLNQPDEADSICRDILAVDPRHQGALRTLGLALTDQFPRQWMHLHAEAIAVFQRLEDPYARVYFTAIAWERLAKAKLEDGLGRSSYDAFQRALELFEEAESLSPKGDPDPVLRWNRCVRALTTEPLLVAAATLPPESDIDLGDAPPG